MRAFDRRRSPRRWFLGPLGHSLAALAGAVAVPVVGVGLAVSRRWRVGFRERLGNRPELPPGAVWVHGASVGEIRAGLGLIRALEDAGYPCVATTTSVTGRDLVRKERPGTPCYLAPIDHPWLTARALARVRPRALVILETDLWPSLITAAHERDVPVFALSARISEHSARRYKWLGGAVAGLLGCFTGIGARSAQDAERFQRLGAQPERVAVTGDLKLQLPEEPERPQPDLERALAGARVWIAGSTHPGEERAACQAQLQLLGSGEAPVLVVAPRHPERFDGVAAEIAKAGLELHRRSALSGAPLSPGSVLLLDSLGELAGLYGLSQLAFVGGSLVDRGGHNPLEAARAGVPILVGPHVRNAQDAVSMLRDAGVLTCVQSEAELISAVVDEFRRADSAALQTGSDWLGDRGNVAAESALWLIERMES